MGLIKRIYQWVKGKCIHVFDLKDRPHAIALGVSVGVFWGFTPFLGLKTLAAMATARLLKGNVIAAAVAVQMHDVAIPLTPVLLGLEYKIGHLLVHHQWKSAANPQQLENQFGAFSFGGLFHWHTLKAMFHSVFSNNGGGLHAVGLITLGSLFVAGPLGIATYWPMLGFLVRRNARKAAKLEADLLEAAVTPGGQVPVGEGILLPSLPKTVPATADPGSSENSENLPGSH